MLHKTEIATLKGSHEVASAAGQETASDAQKRARDLEQTKAADATQVAELPDTIAAQQERVNQLNTMHEKETAALKASNASAVAAALVGASDSQKDAYGKLQAAREEEMKRVEERHASELEFAQAEKQKSERVAVLATSAKDEAKDKASVSATATTSEVVKVARKQERVVLKAEVAAKEAVHVEHTAKLQESIAAKHEATEKVSSLHAAEMVAVKETHSAALAATVSSMDESQQKEALQALSAAHVSEIQLTEAKRSHQWPGASVARGGRSARERDAGSGG